MEDFKGTKGEWRKTFSIEGKKRAVRCDGYLIATLNPPIRFISQDERYDAELKVYEADQNLIVSAPDLLKAAQFAVNAIYENSLENQLPKTLSELQSAITKALGH